MIAATYDPERTQHRQAAARCGLRLKFHGPYSSLVTLIDDTTGERVWGGCYWDCWDYLREVRGLARGAH